MNGETIPQEKDSVCYVGNVNATTVERLGNNIEVPGNTGNFHAIVPTANVDLIHVCYNALSIVSLHRKVFPEIKIKELEEKMRRCK